jgi:hypothetical protein
MTAWDIGVPVRFADLPPCLDERTECVVVQLVEVADGT